MTTQEAINFTLSDPRVAAGRAAYQQNKSIFEAEKNSLQQQINAAQSALDEALKKGSSKQEDLDQLNSNLEKARAAYNDSRKRWGPAYYGQGASLTAALPFAPHGTTLTTEEKQAQSPLYNPLYDPSSVEYKSNLQQISNPNAPQIQNPLAPATTPKVQMPSVAAPKANNNLNSSTSNLLQAVQGQNAPVPSYSTPAAGPNLLAQPKIELPQMFQANFNAPSTTPPNAPNGITMPNWAGQKPKGGFGSNWNDLLSVAYNRQPR